MGATREMKIETLKTASLSPSKIESEKWPYGSSKLTVSSWMKSLRNGVSTILPTLWLKASRLSPIRSLNNWGRRALTQKMCLISAFRQKQMKLSLYSRCAWVASTNLALTSCSKRSSWKMSHSRWGFRRRVSLRRAAQRDQDRFMAAQASLIALQWVLEHNAALIRPMQVVVVSNQRNEKDAIIGQTSDIWVSGESGTQTVCPSFQWESWHLRNKPQTKSNHHKLFRLSITQP